MDSSQMTAMADQLVLVPPTDDDHKLAAKFIRRVLGADCGDILAYLGLT